MMQPLARPFPLVDRALELDEGTVYL
jgi:hypothetical protein